MNLQVISFAGKAFDKDSVKSVNLMTNAGDITILDDHEALISTIKPCVIFIEYKDNSKEELVVGGGIVEVSESKVKILADMMADIHDIDKVETSEAIKNAEALMEKYKDSKDRVDMEKFVEAEDMLLKSVAKLKLSEIR